MCHRESHQEAVMNYGMRIDVERGFDETVAMVREALAENGFGVLTEIDVKSTLKNKIDVDVDEQIILGACNPHFAHQALQVEPSIGALLPCNVVVRTTQGATVVEAIDPATLVAVTGNPDMEPLAEQVSSALKAALDRVALA